MKAIILAAGKGTRMLPLTEHTPKPLVKVAGVPIIDRILHSLPDRIEEVIVVVEYLKEKIISHLAESSSGRPVRYVDQVDMPGTFGALMSAKPFFGPAERLLVINGDDIHDPAELEECLNYDRSWGLQLVKMPDYLSVRLDASGHVYDLCEQTASERLNGALIPTGAYVADASIFESPGVLRRPGEYGLPNTLLAQEHPSPIKGVVTTAWLTMNTVDDVASAEAALEERRRA